MEGMLIDCVSEIRRDLASVSAGNSTAARPSPAHLMCPDGCFCRRPSSSCSVIGACPAERPQPARVPEHADAGENCRTPLRVACKRLMLMAAARCPGPQQTRQNYGEGKFDVDKARCSKKENSASCMLSSVTDGPESQVYKKRMQHTLYHSEYLHINL